MRVFDRNGVLLKTITPQSTAPLVPAGKTRLRLGGTTPGPVKLTLITLGRPLHP